MAGKRTPGRRPVPRLTHVSAEGRAAMVDVGSKRVTRRQAVASGRVRMRRTTLDLIAANAVEKGDVLSVARLAGILGAKATARLIPLTHLLLPDHVDVECLLNREAGAVDITAQVACHGRTGAEMEALTAVAVAALTIYDMCKAVDRGMVLTDIRLEEKRGGKSGTYRRRTR